MLRLLVKQSHLFELTREFCLQGHKVTVFIPDLDYDYSKIREIDGCSLVLVKPGFFLNKKSRLLKKTLHQKNEDQHGFEQEVHKPGLLKRLKTLLIDWFYMGAFSFEYSFTCAFILLRYKGKFDLMITSALPICAHLAGGWAKFFNKKLARIMVADYGDPYSGNQEIKPPFFHRAIEKIALSKFNYVSVPHLGSYFKRIPFSNLNNFKIIPQGISLTNFKIANFSPNQPVNFAYAGTFYKNMRNPKELFDYLLNKKDQDFRFVIYTNLKDYDSYDLIKPYVREFGNKLIIHDFVQREECIFELSKADFLVNIGNRHEEVSSPSKLIDYRLTQRPIYSFQSGKFDYAEFEMFLNGDYRLDISKSIDFEKYNVKNTAKDFLELIPVNKNG